MKKILFFLFLSLVSCSLMAQPTKKCATCGMSIPKCPYKGKHPKPTTPTPTPAAEKKCQSCGKVLSKCPYKGKHPKPSNQLNNSVASSLTGTHNGHEWVDLGLPSGTKWATTNVGATSPSDYGNYYAWGETKPKSSYQWSNLKYCLDSTGEKFSKYVTDSKYGNVDGKKELELSDDAAYVNWGEGWRIPSETQQDELRVKCKWTWTSMGGHNGYNVVGPNGKSIFLPAAGYRNGSSSDYVGSGGNYWSRSLDTSYGSFAFYLYFYSDDFDWFGSIRRCGFAVRAVLAP